MPKNYADINSAAIDQWVRDGWEWGQEISHETYLRAKQGDWSVLLTPTKPVPKEWFCPMQGAKILGLASGGGQQIPIFTALGDSAPYWTIPRSSCARRSWWHSGKAMTSSLSAPT